MNYLQNKKTRKLLIIFSVLALLYRFRHFIAQHTLNRALQIMNNKFIEKMNQKMKSVEEHNRLLEQLKQIDGEYYGRKDYLYLIFSLIEQEQVEQDKNTIRQLDKTQLDYQERRKILYIKLFNSLINQAVTVILQEKLVEIGFLLPHVLVLTQQESFGINKSQEFAILFLKNIELQIIKQYQQMITAHVISEIQRYNLNYAFTELENKISIIEFLENCVRNQNIYQKINYKDILVSLQNEIDISTNQFVQRCLQDSSIKFGEEFNLNIKKLKDALLQLSHYLIKIHQSPAFNTFLIQSRAYSFQKLENRYLILLQKDPQQQNALYFVKMTNFSKILLEEFIDRGSRDLDEKFYSSQIKKSTNITDNTTYEEDYQVLRILHERKLSRYVNQSATQMLRKIVFQDIQE